MMQSSLHRHAGPTPTPAFTPCCQGVSLPHSRRPRAPARRRAAAAAAAPARPGLHAADAALHVSAAPAPPAAACLRASGVLPGQTFACCGVAQAELTSCRLRTRAHARRECEPKLHAAAAEALRAAAAQPGGAAELAQSSPFWALQRLLLCEGQMPEELRARAGEVVAAVKTALLAEAGEGCRLACTGGWLGHGLVARAAHASTLPARAHLQPAALPPWAP